MGRGVLDACDEEGQGACAADAGEGCEDDLEGAPGGFYEGEAYGCYEHYEESYG